MKNFIVFLSIFIFLSPSYAYFPTSGDVQIIADYRQKMDIIKSKNQLRILEIKAMVQELLIKHLENERLTYIFGEFKNYISSIYQSDIDKYFDSVKGLPPARCLEHLEDVDFIAQKKDFPTALILALRYKEHHCFYDNPPNGRGLFQISTKNYETGEITAGEFTQQINDFIDFSRGKINAYNNNKKFGTGDIKLTYDVWDADSIRIFAYIYRGYKKTETPRDSKFVNGNINDDLAASEDGAFTLFVKFIKNDIDK